MSRPKKVTHYTSSLRILLNTCCTGISIPGAGPEKRVVLGHCCQSSISREYLNARFRRLAAREEERPLNAFSHPCLFALWTHCNLTVALTYAHS